MTVFESTWRCDLDGETFNITIEPVIIEGDEPVHPNVYENLERADMLVENVPCPICHGPMRRVVSILDHRDWGAQIG